MKNNNNKQRRIVNIINFIRGTEPRIPDLNLLKPVKKQIELLQKYNFPGTFLLQYDALIQKSFINLIKKLPRSHFDIGIWFEVVEPLCKKAGIKWEGRYSWDWHANTGFLIGYTPKEREKLIDIAMEDFKNTFGYFPKSVGAWFIDAYSLNYLYNKYDIIASCNCKDQVGTDGYTLWGGYWNQAYYPSKVNSYMPAQAQKNQIPVPVFRMLGSDPIYQYDLDVGSKRQSVVTLEPVYEKGGGSSKWIKWYFDLIFNSPCLSYAYTQIGQENSFGWEKMKKGLKKQFKLLDSINENDKKPNIRIETLKETGQWYKSKYKLTPSTAVTAMKDWQNKGNKSIWFNNRFYRTNIFWEENKLRIRDIHFFNEDFTGSYFKDVCTNKSFTYKTLPILDGYFWSTNNHKAGIRLVKIAKGDNRKKEIIGNNINVIEKDNNQLHINWELNKNNTLKIYCKEKELSFKMKTECLNKWGLEMSWSQKCGSKIKTIENKSIKYSFKGCKYGFSLKKGNIIQKENNNILLLVPESNQINIKFNTIR